MSTAAVTGPPLGSAVAMMYLSACQICQGTFDGLHHGSIASLDRAPW
jgi:hypothetical protein